MAASTAPHALTMRPYRPRRVRFQHLTSRHGTTLKVYAITMDDDQVPAEAVEAALHIAFAYLTTGSLPCLVAGIDWTRLPSHGAGSLIVHAGREALFAVLDCWTDENMLRHQVWAAPRGVGTHRPVFEPLAPSGIAMCVWELAVIQHERAAWLRHVLTPSGQSDLTAYFADVLEADL